MKKIILLCSIFVVFLISGYFAFFHEQKTDLEKVKVADATLS